MLIYLQKNELIKKEEETAKDAKNFRKGRKGLSNNSLTLSSLRNAFVFFAVKKDKKIPPLR